MVFESKAKGISYLAENMAVQKILASQPMHTAAVRANEALPFRFKHANFLVMWSLLPAYHACFLGFKKPHKHRKAMLKTHNLFQSLLLYV